MVYAHPNGVDYVANFEQHGWLQWPAIEDGWILRRRCSATIADTSYELPLRLADLAVRLSGVR